jgi:hypothetical protein
MAEAAFDAQSIIKMVHDAVHLLVCNVFGKYLQVFIARIITGKGK